MGDNLWAWVWNAGRVLQEKRAGERSGRCRACLRYMLRICNKGWLRMRAYTGYNLHHRRPTLCFLPSHFGHDRRRLRRRPRQRQEQKRLSARNDCHSSRSPEAAKHVPLILPPLDDDCLISCTLPWQTSFRPSPLLAIHDVHDGQPL